MLNIFRTKRKTWAIKTRNDSEGIECVLQNWRRQSIKKTLCMIQLYSILAKLLYFPNYSQWLCCKMIIRCLSPSLAEKNCIYYGLFHFLHSTQQYCIRSGQYQSSFVLPPKYKPYLHSITSSVVSLPPSCLFYIPVELLIREIIVSWILAE